MKTDYNEVAPSYDGRYQRYEYAGTAEALRAFIGATPVRAFEHERDQVLSELHAAKLRLERGRVAERRCGARAAPCNRRLALTRITTCRLLGRTGSDWQLKARAQHAASTIALIQALQPTTERRTTGAARPPCERRATTTAALTARACAQLEP